MYRTAGSQPHTHTRLQTLCEVRDLREMTVLNMFNSFLVLITSPAARQPPTTFMKVII